MRRPGIGTMATPPSATAARWSPPVDGQRKRSATRSWRNFSSMSASRRLSADTVRREHAARYALSARCAPARRHTRLRRSLLLRRSPKYISVARGSIFGAAAHRWIKYPQRAKSAVRLKHYSATLTRLGPSAGQNRASGKYRGTPASMSKSVRRGRRHRT